MNYVQGRVFGLSHCRMMSFALCVVLAIDNVNGSGALHPEVVEPKVANSKACDFRDTKAGHCGQHGEQPVTVKSHRLGAPPKQVGHDAFVNWEFQTIQGARDESARGPFSRHNGWGGQSL